MSPFEVAELPRTLYLIFVAPGITDWPLGTGLESADTLHWALATSRLPPKRVLNYTDLFIKVNKKFQK